MTRQTNHTGRHRENRTEEREKIGRTFLPLAERLIEERPGRSKGLGGRTDDGRRGKNEKE